MNQRIEFIRFLVCSFILVSFVSESYGEYPDPGNIAGLPDDLLVYIDFDEGSGPDASGEVNFAYDRQGDLEGSFRGPTERTDGLVGTGAALFDGQPEVGVLLGDGEGVFDVNTGITVEVAFTTLWEGETLAEFFRKEDGANRILLSLQPDRFVGTFGNEHLIDGDPAIIGEPGISGVSMGLNIDGVYGELDIAFDGEDGRPEIDGLADGGVHHIAGTYDAATGRNAIYLDGKVIGEVMLPAGAEITSGGGAEAIIGNVGTGEPFDGVIDEFALWNRALSAEEIAVHSANILAGKSYFESAGAPGDFDADGDLDVDDVNALIGQINGAMDAAFDVSGDGSVDRTDLTSWVKDLRKTWIGDANIDGEFNSSDFVAVFQAGKFENQQSATWAEGDWNGDGLFNSSDFVAAFQDGGFESGPLPATRAVPEPNSRALLLCVLSTVCLRRRLR